MFESETPIEESLMPDSSPLLATRFIQLAVGSGRSFHNMRGSTRTGASLSRRQVDSWLGRHCASGAEEHAPPLLSWAEAPGAQFWRPREEHLKPLMGIVTAKKGEPGGWVFVDIGMCVAVSASEFDGRCASSAVRSTVANRGRESLLLVGDDVSSVGARCDQEVPR